MKNKFAVFVMLLVLSASCGPSSRLTTDKISLAMHIEYREDISVGSIIMNKLRMAKAKDITVKRDVNYIAVDAIFVEVTRDNDPIIAILEEELNRTVGVLLVTVQKTYMPQRGVQFPTVK